MARFGISKVSETIANFSPLRRAISVDRAALRGFTIVELLIVIVVIAILAAITTVAYNGIQQRAQDAQADSGLNQIKKALELYHTDSGSYPAVCPGGDGTGCAVSTLSSALSPTYVATVPSAYGLYQYVRGAGIDGYGIYMRYYTRPNCKTGVNVVAGWWGSSVPTC
jgi:prepilin-type N-terminal cleavage/methylation domain-containing protein